jgi:hypothetical protein
MQLFLPKYERLKDRQPQNSQKVSQLLREIDEERGRLASLEGEIQSLNAQIRMKRGYLTPALPARHTRVSSLPPPVSLSPAPEAVGERSVDKGKLFPSMYKKDFVRKKLPAEQRMFGRPKDQVWEYREEMQRNKHLVRGNRT